MATALSEEEKLKVKSLLTSPKKLDRESGAVYLSTLLSGADEDLFKIAERIVLDIAADSESTWEARQGALIGARTVLLSSENRNCPEFDCGVLQHSLKMLGDCEYAVRQSAGEVIGALCKKNGCNVYCDIRPLLITGILSHLEVHDVQAPVLQPLEQPTDVSAVQPKILQHKPVGAELNDLSRWKFLETWMKCLHSVIESCGTSFNNYIEEEVLQLMTACLKNSSRFVRETACLLVGAMIDTNFGSDGQVLVAIESSSVCAHACELSQFLASALGDTCSQVRMAACICARKFLVGLPEGVSRHSSMLILLPALCFNRYYAAEGVKLHSQETWNMITKGTGKQLVEDNIDSVIEFYLTQLTDPNPEVKDTACVCITELSQKMDSSVLSRHVPKLLLALQSAFSSDSFSSRDASCIACGKLIVAFNVESKPSMDSLYAWLFELLQDNAPPVREAAAIALSNIVSSYGQEALNHVLPAIKAGLEDVERSIESGVPSHQLAADAGTLTQCSADVGTQLKLHKTHRAPERWELADGCLCLLCELSTIPVASNEVVKLLPCLASAASHRHYSHHVFFLQSVCKQLPVLFRNLGKRFLKMYLEIFFDVIFYAASCDSIHVNEASRECIDLLSKALGPSIFRAKVESYNARYLSLLPPQ